MSESTISTFSSIESVNISNETNHDMWNQIARMPFDLLSRTNEFMYIEKVMRLISKYHFEAHDDHMIDPHYTLKLCTLLLTVSSKSLTEIEHLREEIRRINNKKTFMENYFTSEIEKQPAEVVLGGRNAMGTNLSDKENSLVSKENISKTNESRLNNELGCLEKENSALLLELNKEKHANEELRQLLQTQHEEITAMKQDDAKMHLEYRHLDSRHHRLIERFEKTQRALEEYIENDTQRGQYKENGHLQLREEIKLLQRENYSLNELRNQAEELCEQRESEALRDMTKLRRISKDLIDEERCKLREATEHYAALKKEHSTNMAHLVDRHAEDLRVKDEEIALLRQQLDRISTKRTKHSEDDTVLMASRNEDSYRFIDSSSEKSERRRLERENSDLAAEVEELELRIDTMGEENKRLSSFIKNYECGDEGLLRFRHQLTDQMRTVEILQDENTQLRERLNYMEDSLSFTVALEKLCKKVGVTDAEITSLRSKNTTGYDEMATIREELNVLKQEIEWLEKDRRHWMNKVRLQPLIFTKLRFELGLTAEQLKRLDALVDQMKSTKITIDDGDSSHKEKYLKKSEIQHTDAQEFKEYLKTKIESAIKGAFKTLNDGTSLESVLTSLEATIETLKPVNIDDPNLSSAISSLKAELASTKRQVDEFELTIKDNESVIQALRGELASSVDEKEALVKECNQYKSFMFATLDSTSDVANNTFDKCRYDDGNVQKAGAVHRDTTKWASIASSLRDQLKMKDDVVEVLKLKLSEVEKNLEEKQRQIETEKQLSLSNLHIKETLNDQIVALQEMNEEMNEKNVELRKINSEVTSAMDQMENGSCRELLQKVVLLRRREAKLLSRLRKAIAAQEDAVAAERRLQFTIDTTFKNLQDALEGSSTGFVLPPSSAFHDHEKKIWTFCTRLSKLSFKVSCSVRIVVTFSTSRAYIIIWKSPKKLICSVKKTVRARELLIPSKMRLISLSCRLRCRKIWILTCDFRKPLTIGMGIKNTAPLRRLGGSLKALCGGKSMSIAISV
ncbi:unnamed protein product, partial [Phytomonas sp. Hart1]